MATSETTIVMDPADPRMSIWLEVANVRLNSDQVEIVVKGDKTDKESVWRSVEFKKVGFEDANETYRAITEGLDKKRVVIAEMKASSNGLNCSAIRIQYAESNSR